MIKLKSLIKENKILKDKDVASIFQNAIISIMDVDRDNVVILKYADDTDPNDPLYHCQMHFSFLINYINDIYYTNFRFNFLKYPINSLKKTISNKDRKKLYTTLSNIPNLLPTENLLKMRHPQISYEGSVYKYNKKNWKMMPKTFNDFINKEINFRDAPVAGKINLHSEFISISEVWWDHSMIGLIKKIKNSMNHSDGFDTEE